MRSLFFSAALLFAIVPAAQAQVSQGTQEIILSGSAIFQEDRSATSIGIQYGYFVTPAVEIGPRLGLSRTSLGTLEGGGRESFSGGQLGAFTHLHLVQTDAAVVPFVGAEFDLGFGYGRGFADVRQYGILGGAKLFLTPGGAVTPAVYFRNDSNGDSFYGVQLGISLFF